MFQTVDFMDIHDSSWGHSSGILYIGGLYQVCQSFPDVKYFTCLRKRLRLEPPKFPASKKGQNPILQTNLPDPQNRRPEVACFFTKFNTSSPFPKRRQQNLQLREWFEIATFFLDTPLRIIGLSYGGVCFSEPSWFLGSQNSVLLGGFSLVRYLLLLEPSRQASESFSSQKSTVKGVDSVLIDIRWTKYDKIQLISGLCPSKVAAIEFVWLLGRMPTFLKICHSHFHARQGNQSSSPCI